MFVWKLDRVVPSRGVLYPTRITDRHGNVVVITYRNGRGPEIDTIVDSLGRAIVFHYDAEDRLTAITAPGLGGERERTVVRFNWMSLALVDLEHAFSPVGEAPRAIRADGTPIRRLTLTALRAAYFPATSSGYWCGEPWQYSAYGNLGRIIEQRGMGFDGAPLTAQGTITPGRMTRERVYDYPLAEAGLDRAPTYKTVTEAWEGMDTPPAVTRYEVKEVEEGTRIKVTQPDGTSTVTHLLKAPGKSYDGYPHLLEVFSGEKRLRAVASDWESGEYNAPRPQRGRSPTSSARRRLPSSPTARSTSRRRSANWATAASSFDATRPHTSRASPSPRARSPRGPTGHTYWRTSSVCRRWLRYIRASTRLPCRGSNTATTVSRWRPRPAQLGITPLSQPRCARGCDADHHVGRARPA